MFKHEKIFFVIPCVIRVIGSDLSPGHGQIPIICLSTHRIETRPHFYNFLEMSLELFVNGLQTTAIDYKNAEFPAHRGCFF